MSRLVALESAPTMIIPKGTEIELDQHGQLSIRAPGNLVIQNSGTYGTIESVLGSVRIDPNVEVEAVNIRCAKACYVQGSLTAWKVEAESIELEDAARAHIMLQVTESLQIGKRARLVGNFASEKELFLLFSRFARQMRALPFGFERRDSAADVAAPRSQRRMGRGAEGARRLAAGGEFAEDTELEAPSASVPGEELPDLPDALFFAMVLLEREVERPGSSPTYRRAAQELLRCLRSRDIEQLRDSHRDLFDQVAHPSEDLRRARELIAGHFA